MDQFRLLIAFLALLSISCKKASFNEFYKSADFKLDSSYKLIFYDDFNGVDLDTTKWIYRSLGPWKSSIMSKDAIKLDGDGNLLISTYKKNDKVYTGMISSQNRQSFLYGYFECRARLNKATGHWSAFWLQSNLMGNNDPSALTGGAEVDIYEYYGVSKKNVVFQSLHWGGYGANHSGRSSYTNIPNLEYGFHTFALEWTPGSYKFIVDGKVTWEISEGVSGIPLYIILSTEVHDFVTGEFLENEFPDNVTIDYVKVYQKKY